MTGTPEDDARIEKALAQLRILAAALVMGVATFTAIVLLVPFHGGQAEAPPQPLLPIPLPALGLLIGLGPLTGSFILKSVLLKPACFLPLAPEARLDAFLTKYRQATITALALCEGAAFMVLVFTMVDASAPKMWVLAAGLPMLGMFFHFPTRLAVDGRLDEIAAQARG